MNFNTLWQHLGDPEYLHVLINPMPVYGLAIGVLALVLALLLRNQRVTIAALVLVFVSALSAWPAYHYGEAAYDRVKALSDPAGEQWLDEHMARGEKMIWMFYVLAGVAAVGIIVVVKWPRATFPITIGTLLLDVATLGVGGWIAYPGGHVRHREFRFEPPPAAREEHHHADSEEHGAEMHGASKPAPAMDHGAMPQAAAPPSEEQLGNYIHCSDRSSAHNAVLGSARVSRAGQGVPPWRTFPVRGESPQSLFPRDAESPSRDRHCTQDARATRNDPLTARSIQAIQAIRSEPQTVGSGGRGQGESCVTVSVPSAGRART